MITLQVIGGIVVLVGLVIHLWIAISAFLSLKAIEATLSRMDDNVAMITAALTQKHKLDSMPHANPPFPAIDGPQTETSP